MKQDSRKQEKGRKKGSRSKAGGIPGKALLSAAVILGLVGVGFAVFVAGGQASDPSGLPKYALVSPSVKEAYLYATAKPEELNGVPCHCGCMQMAHEGRIHKRGLIDCYFKEDGSYDPHASTCAQCVTDTLEVKDLAARNTSKEEIKRTIDAKYQNN